MFEKIKNFIKSLYVYYCYICFYITGYLKYKTGKAYKFTNIRFYNGEPITASIYIKFASEGYTILLKSDQGNLIFNHGNPDGSLQIKDIGRVSMLDDRFLSMIPKGQWGLISCFNGMRDNLYLPDLSWGFTLIYPHATHILHAPLWNGTMYVFESNNIIQKMLGIKGVKK